MESLELKDNLKCKLRAKFNHNTSNRAITILRCNKAVWSGGTLPLYSTKSDHLLDIQWYIKSVSFHGFSKRYTVEHQILNIQLRHTKSASFNTAAMCIWVDTIYRQPFTYQSIGHSRIE